MLHVKLLYCFFYETLEMAGNIIPAIATTNAIIAGMIVMQSFKILNEKLNECKTVHIKIFLITIILLSIFKNKVLSCCRYF
jgi:hypothetical protein